MATIDINEYTYTYTVPSSGTTGTCSAKINSTYNTSSYTAYGGLFDEIIVDGVKYTLTSLNGCFQGCTYLQYPPRIPSTVTNMGSCFYGCTSLKFPPLIPDGVTTLQYCFSDCTSLWNGINISYQRKFRIPDSVRTMWGCFQNCTSMIVAPILPNISGDYDNCFSGCTSLKYVGGMPYVSYGSNTFYNCSSLIAGPTVIKTDGSNYNSNAYTGTLTALQSPNLNGSGGTLNLKSLLLKIFDTTAFNSSTTAGYFTSYVINYTSNFKTWLDWLSKTVGSTKRAQAFTTSSNFISAMRQHFEDGFGFHLMNATNTADIDITDSYNVSIGDNFQAAYSAVSGEGYSSGWGVFASFGNYHRGLPTNLAGTITPYMYSTGSLYTGRIYWIRSSTSDTTLTSQMGCIGIIGGKSVDQRALT